MTNSNNVIPATEKSQVEDQWVETKSPATVRGMFASISPTYDTLNHVFSLNIDRLWRKKLSKDTIHQVKPHRILDVCGGTGDLSLALEAEARKTGLRPLILCSDFTPQMTQIARQKFSSAKVGNVIPMVADTTALPFQDDQFDLVTVAFGIRNVVNPLLGLQEMNRVCRPGGTVAVLEFSKTRNPAINWAFDLYFSKVLPLIGKAVTGTRAYSYLSKSVAKFPEGEEFCRLITKATGSPTKTRRLSFGIATLYTSTKRA